MANIIFWNSFGEELQPVRPYGAHCLAQWLIHNGHTAHVIDFCNALTLDQLVAITEKHIDSSTIAVGVSTTFWQSRSSFLQHSGNFVTRSSQQHEPDWVVNARLALSKKYPTLKWLLGGPNAGSYGKNAVFEWTTFWGNAEDSLLKFVQDHIGTSTNTLFDITTATCKYADGLSIQPNEVIPMELGRGCQFKCKFCSYPLIGKKKGTYLRDFSTIEADLLRNYEKYGVTTYTFLDDTVNESTEKIEALATIAQRLPFKLRWIGYNRLDLIGSQPETIEMLESSGLIGTFFGIESFHPGASKAVGKGWNGKHGKEFLAQLMSRWRYKVNMTLGLIIGLPGESYESVIETDQWCVDNEIHSWYFAPLYMSHTATNGSEFSKNYSMYGYKFPKATDAAYWESDLWTRSSAIALAKELNTRRSSSEALSSVWEFPKYLALGYSFEELMSVSQNKLTRINLKNSHSEFINKYVNDQL